MWTIINDPSNTIWEKIDDSKIQLDVKWLEDNFAMKVNKPLEIN